MWVNDMYKLLNANEEHLELLKKWKSKTIFDYATNIEDSERKRIINYINIKVPQFLNEYKMIVIDSEIAGCLLVTQYEDGILIDELYIEDEFRNRGIGSDIICNIIKKNSPVYAWVYKNNSTIIQLCLKLNFKIIEETKDRYFIKYYD